MLRYYLLYEFLSISRCSSRFISAFLAGSLLVKYSYSSLNEYSKMESTSSWTTKDGEVPAG